MGRIGALRITIAVQEGERGLATRHAIMLCWRCARQRDLVVRLAETPSRRLFMQPNLAATRAAPAELNLPPPTAIVTPRAS
jgi:hypothetical protein